MSDKFFKVKKGMNLQPIDPSTITDAEAGDLILDSTSGNVLKSYNPISATFEEVKGQGGGFNYFENDGAEVDLSGFTVYANTTPSTRPDDFGGTPDAGFTLTRNTTDPLLGEADFLITKPAANVQGHGVYYQFTAENGHLASKLLFQTLAETSNLNDADISIHLVSSSDSFVADFNVISANNPDVSAGLPQIMKQFQLDSSDTEYRLCIHYNSTDTDAKTFRLDELKFAPSSVATSPVVTDFKDFTPTGTWTNAVYTGSYRRVGDTAVIQYRVVLTGAGSGNLRLDLPDGLSVDEDKLQNTSTQSTYRGVGATLDDGADFYDITARWRSDLGVIEPSVKLTDAAESRLTTITATVPFTYAADDVVNLEIQLPIQGWSANTISSEDLGGRDILSLVTLGTQQNLTTTPTKLNLDTVIEDTSSSFESALSRIIIKESGAYDINAQSIMQALDDGNLVEIAIYKNGTRLRANRERANAISTNAIVTLTVSVSENLTKDDFIEIYVTNFTSNTGSVSSDSSLTFLNVVKRNSPQTILETETVHFEGTSTSGQTLNSTSSVFIYEESLRDSHNAYDTTTGKFTAPYSKIYSISPSIIFLSTTTSGFREVNIMINGSLRHREIFNNNQTKSYSYSKDFYLEKGDELEIFARDSSSASGGGASTNPHQNTLTIKG